VSAGQRLSRRQLNRTLLARQLLDVPSGLPVADVVSRVAGLQAQVPRDPYLGLLARLGSFAPDDLGREITERRLVRVALMRSTIHLVTAADCWALRPVVQPALDRELRTVATWARPLDGLDLADVVAAARALLRGQPMTNAELGALLREKWPDRDGRAMAYAVRNREPLVQVPPRGLWGMPGQPRHATARDWLGDPPGQWPPSDPRPGLEAMALRYLAAFGPATIRDIQAWAGVTRLAEVIEGLRARLVRYAADDGRELWDVPGGVLADEEAPAPVRLLPEYDNAVLGYADRGRVLPDGVTFTSYAARLRAKSLVRGGILLDGFLAGTWSAAAAEGGGYVLRADPFGRTAPDAAARVEEESWRLLGFLAGDVATCHVEVSPAA
jgi:hypothetical protein